MIEKEIAVRQYSTIKIGIRYVFYALSRSFISGAQKMLPVNYLNRFDFGFEREREREREREKYTRSLYTHSPLTEY